MTAHQNDTEFALLYWRSGQPQAERLAAAVLSLGGFESIDPQCPLGGPDGLKDAICNRDGKRFIGAFFFPPTAQSYSQLRTKFKSDLDGVVKNVGVGIAFVTNQRLTPTEREKLEKTALKSGIVADVFHLERIRALLDLPRGYGIRAQYLGIMMSKEEQLAYFADRDEQFASILREAASLSRASNINSKTRDDGTISPEAEQILIKSFQRNCPALLVSRNRKLALEVGGETLAANDIETDEMALYLKALDELESKSLTIRDGHRSQLTTSGLIVAERLAAPKKSRPFRTGPGVFGCYGKRVRIWPILDLGYADEKTALYVMEKLRTELFSFTDVANRLRRKFSIWTLLNFVFNCITEFPECEPETIDWLLKSGDDDANSN